MPSVWRMRSLLVWLVLAISCCDYWVQAQQVACGTDHTCMIQPDSRLLCIGKDEWGQITNAPTEAVSSVFTSSYMTCALFASNSTLTCWGDWYNNHQHGKMPDAPLNQVFHEVALASWRACALNSTGLPTCWGRFSNYTAPVGVAFRTLTVSNEYVCGLRRSDSHLLCWGKVWGYGTP